MSDARVDRYLRELAMALKARGVRPAPLLGEARDHLDDAVTAGEQRGLSRDDAVTDALRRFGSSDDVAQQWVAARADALHPVMLTTAALVGLAIAWADARPHWDDTGITAFSMVLAAGCFGLLIPWRPWHWALAVGAWIPLDLFARTPTAGTAVGGLVILGFPLAGALVGAWIRRRVTVA